MTVSELIKELSAVEEQDREVFLSEICIVPVERVDTFSFSDNPSGTPASSGCLLIGIDEPLRRNKEGDSMTVSELIKALSALEKQDQAIWLRGNNWFEVPIEEISESSGDGLTCYVLAEKSPDPEDEVIKQAEKGLVEYCNKTNRIRITPDMEIKAIQIAEVIWKNTYGSERNIELDDVDWRDLREFLCLMSACRKAVIDDFPLKDYIMIEVPSVTDEYVIIYFTEPDGRCTGQTFNPHAHEIVFQCFFGNPVAIPLSEKGSDLEEHENCFKAVYECGNY